MTIPQLTSRDNPILKTVRLVSAGSRRAPRDLVTAEGIRVLEEVENSGYSVNAVLLSEKFGSAVREQKLMEKWLQPSRKVRLYRIGAALFQSISAVQTPQGAIALVQVPCCRLESIELLQGSMVLYASGIQDPGNLGTLIRAAAASGAHLVCTGSDTVSARNPKAIRSSAGSFFRMPVAERVDAAEFIRYCERFSISVYRTDARAGLIYTKADMKTSCAVVVGNEGSGRIEDAFAGVPAIRIPMTEGMDSLNVAVAGAVILFEARRQRMERESS